MPTSRSPLSSALARRLALGLICAALGLASAGCPSPILPGSPEAGTPGGRSAQPTEQYGTLQVLLTDAPPSQTIQEVWITVLAVEVHSREQGWLTVADHRPDGVAYDLLRLKDNTAPLGTATLSAGTYTQVRLLLSAVNHVVTAEPGGDISHPLTVASGEQTGVKITGLLEVRSGFLTTVVLDFDAGASVVCSGDGAYRLKPTVAIAQVGYEPVPPPPAPEGLTATVAGTGPVLLAWEDNSGGAAAFRIQRRSGPGGAWQLLATVGAGTVSYADESLQPLTTYGYRVLAFAGGAVSAPSNTAEATVPQPVEVTALDGGSYDYLGFAVSASGGLAAAGAPGRDGYRGAVCLFRLAAGSWLQEATLFAAGGQPDDRFGSAVSMNGGRLLVGAYLADLAAANAGAAYLFEAGPSGWVETARLCAPDASGGDYFGTAVAVDGDRALVGAPFNDQGGTNAGVAYLFRQQGGAWTLETRLTASDPAPGDQFGAAVALQGGRALVGAFGKDGFRGAAYLFNLDAPGWPQEAKLAAPGAPAYGLFGYAVALAGDLAVVGAYGEDRFSGAAYLFVPFAGAWALQSRLTPAGAAEGDRFGFSVAAAPQAALVGAPGRHGEAAQSGAAYLFRAGPDGWAEAAALSPQASALWDQTGTSVGLDGPHAVLGAPGADGGGPDTGSVWLY